MISKLKRRIIKFLVIGKGTYILNFLVQRIFTVNSKCSFVVHFTSRINFPQGIVITDNEEFDGGVYLSFASSIACYINAHNGIHFGKNVLFASGVKLISANHDILDKSKHINEPPIILEDNVWLGANVIVLPGVKIGKNSVIGAGSVVTKCIPDNSIAVGNPAKVIKEIENYDKHFKCG